MHPCAVCRKEKKIEVDHLSARGWESAKQNDLATLALCVRHHRERHQIGDQKFEAKYGINLWKEVSSLHIELLMHMQTEGFVLQELDR